MRCLDEFRAKPTSWNGYAAIAVGVVGIMFPLLYTAFFVDHAGELGLLVVAFGAYVTLMQIGVWAVLLWVMRAQTGMSIATVFALGPWVSLGLTLLVFIRWQDVTSAAACYVITAVASATATQFLFVDTASPD